MSEERGGLGIEELAMEAGVPVRTVRFYIAEGLLPSPAGRGKAASYGNEHLLRLRLIRMLAEQRVPLAEQRARVAALSLNEVRSLLAEEEARQVSLHEAASPKEYLGALLRRARAARAEPAPSASAAPPRAPAATLPTSPEAKRQRKVTDGAYPLSPAREWRRWELAPGVELHVREDSRWHSSQLIERLLRAAGAMQPGAEPSSSASRDLRAQEGE